MDYFFGWLGGLATFALAILFVKRRLWWWGLHYGVLYKVYKVVRVGENLNLMLQDREHPRTKDPELYRVPDNRTTHAVTADSSIVELRSTPKGFMLVVNNPVKV